MSAARHLAFASVALPLPASQGALERSRRSVLYIDDDWQNLADCCTTLERGGYTVTATDSPAAGLSAFIEETFDAVILNFHLPFVSNGLLAQVMHKFRHDVPLLLISDGSEEQDLSPWDRRISEGVHPEQLLANLQAVIEDGRRARIAAAIVAGLPPIPLH